MHLSELLTPERIVCNLSAQSKKRALENISEIIATGQPEITPSEVFDCLLARERLGGTGIGFGVAIPHGRLKNITQAIGAFVRLEHAIDFDSIDNQPVDLIFALLVPENSTEEHLQILASIASMFNEESARTKLRQAENSADISNIINSR
ncbi:MAG: PTS IIA-like nitrogen regulatory protein PtsN [Gammaproteobacteria bacterium]|nr:PTS IIA-like nitrogen regulatory protein PtsN [Gammaproteobacteria bacterium]